MRSAIYRLQTISAAILCALLFLAGPASASTKSWSFQVFLGDTPIGHQSFSVNDDGATSTVTITARLDVKVLSFSVYRYTHDDTEQWRGNCLANLNARTDDNGEQLSVTTETTESKLIAIGKTGRVPLGDCAMSFAYWNPQILQQTHLLNSQTGELQQIAIAEMGEEKIQVRGIETQTKRYRISGLKKPIDLWYSNDGEWLALEAIVAGGRKLRYQLE
ncbi:MAG: hypothetical protein JWM78_2902 [Verrucomicrobiaceae bacterium]|nr:hypothetical protein [Verrucomicrobiaceae bacterium]